MYIKNNSKYRELSKKANKYRSELLRKTTKSELRLKVFLLERKVKFEEQFIVFRIFNSEAYSFYICDFYLPKKKLIIEVDGRQHDDPDNKKYDSKRTMYLKEAGYRVVRLKNEETIDQNKIYNKLKRYI